MDETSNCHVPRQRHLGKKSAMDPPLSLDLETNERARTRAVIVHSWQDGRETT
jgi:hypothetical protein